jgi:2-polyprenyl-3-methyl-5-hydroxy-6-metoxy-1,4-benzoquinol methylase
LLWIIHENARVVVVVNTSDGRTGSGIREFLEYYILVILHEGASTAGKIIELIQERSSDNMQYRPGSALQVADEEVERAIAALLKRKCIGRSDGGGIFEITDVGKEALEEANAIKEKTGGSKDEAIEKLVSLLEPCPPKKYILDVGTGEGYLAFKLAEAGFKVIGIDSGDFGYSKDSIQKAREKINGERNYDLEFRVANVKELVDMENTFDYVVASQAVHCMKDQSGCLKAIYHLLKSGGKFLSADLLVGLRCFFVHGFHCFLALSKEEWEQTLAWCGYANVKLHEVNDFCIVEAQRPVIG